MRTKKQIATDYQTFLKKKLVRDFTEDEAMKLLMEKLYDTKIHNGATVSSTEAWWHFINFVIKEEQVTKQKCWNRFVKEAFELVEFNRYSAFVAARGLGKSFVTFVLYPIFKKFLFENMDILICTNIPKMAKRNLRILKRVVDTNEMLLEKKDMSNMKLLKWGDTELEYNHGMIETVSLGSTPRSAHVPLVIIDDPLRDDNTYSDEYVENFILKQVVPCTGRTKGRVILNGTFQHPQDIFHKIMGSKPDFRGKIVSDGTISDLGFCSKVFPAVEDWKTKKAYLPEVYSWEDLMQLRKTIGELAFSQEYLCFKGDTKIKTINGFDAIKDIVVGDLVLTHNGRYRKVLNVIKRNYVGNMINLLGHGNNSIVSTPEHPILVKREKEYEFIKARDVLTTDYLVQKDNLNKSYKKEYDLTDYHKSKYLKKINHKGIDYMWEHGNIINNNKLTKLPKNAIFQKITLTPELCELFGWYLAEASIGSANKCVVFNLGPHEVKEADRIKYLFKKIFNKIAIIKLVRTSLNVKINNKAICKFFVEMCGVHSSRKILNKDFYQFDEQMKCSLLSAYFHGDGSYVGRTVSCVTVSKDLQLGIRRILDSLGIPSTLSIKAPSTYTIEGRTGKTRECYSLVITGNSFTKFMKKVENKSTNEFYDIYKKHEGDLCLYKVKDIINEEHSGQVYNIEVEEDNTYVTESGVVHNCEVVPNKSVIFPWPLIRQCIPSEPEFEQIEQGEPGKFYVIGVDLASSASKTADFTSFVVLEYDIETSTKILRKVVNDRMTAEEQEELLINLAKDFNNAFVMVEKNNIGEWMRQKLESANVYVNSFVTSRQSKQNAIKFLRNELSNKRILFPPLEGDMTVLRKQLTSFGYKMSRGKRVMEALSGHDDVVDALWIANMATQDAMGSPSAAYCQ